MEMSRLMRDGTAKQVSRDQILRHERRQEKKQFSCSSDHVQDWQPYPVGPYSCYMCDHTLLIAVAKPIYVVTKRYDGQLLSSRDMVTVRYSNVYRVKKNRDKTLARPNHLITLGTHSLQEYVLCLWCEIQLHLLLNHTLSYSVLSLPLKKRR